MITMTNEFHNTRTTIPGKVGEIVSEEIYQEVVGVLCSNPDCHCGKFNSSPYYLEATAESLYRENGPLEYEIRDSADDDVAEYGPSDESRVTATIPRRGG